MPTLIELILSPASLTVFALYAAIIAWEALVPARALPRVSGWPLKGLALFALYFILSSYLPLL